MGDNPPGGKVTAAATKSELYDSILLAVGLMPQGDERLGVDLKCISVGKLKLLQEKVKNGAFDVFLAHNSLTAQRSCASVMNFGDRVSILGLTWSRFLRGDGFKTLYSRPSEL